MTSFTIHSACHAPKLNEAPSLHQVDTMKAISAGRPGNVTGRYWEMLVFSNLKECVKIEYSFKDKSGSPAANYLNLSGYLSKKDTRKSLENIISDNHRGMIVHCPNAEAFDFLIFDNCNSIHAIQVTTQTAAKKCSGSDFFKNENIHFKYLLTPFEVDVDTMIKSKSKLQQAYMTYGLRIVSGASFLTRKETIYEPVIASPPAAPSPTLSSPAAASRSED